MANDFESDFDTTLVRRGQHATTFRDMTEFVSGIEDRPLDKLLGDLAGLARLSEMKFALARQTLRRRMRGLPEIDREQLRIFAEEVVTTADEKDADRIRSVFVQQGEA